MNKSKQKVIGMLIAVIFLLLNVYVVVVAISALFATGHPVIAWLLIINSIGVVVGNGVKAGAK